ncbi:MAG: hypothetical protein ABMA25_05340 [Ilumatobacteraceae bacterium]
MVERTKGEQGLAADVLRRYGFSVPTEGAIQLIAEHAQRGVVEIGAGTGYWAHRLSRAGVDVVAFDRFPPPSSSNQWFAGVPPWHAVHAGDEAVVERFPERLLLIVWPTRDEIWATEALERFHRAGGDLVAYVGDGPGGRTGDASFHAVLGESTTCLQCAFGATDEACICGVASLFARVIEIPLPPWQSDRDTLSIFQRRSGRVARRRTSSRRRR